MSKKSKALSCIHWRLCEERVIFGAIGYLLPAGGVTAYYWGDSFEQLSGTVFGPNNSLIDIFEAAMWDLYIDK